MGGVRSGDDTMTRLGEGEFYQTTPDGVEDDPTYNAREIFVRVAMSEIPGLRDSFARGVTPGLERVLAECGDFPFGLVMDSVTTSLGLQSAQAPAIDLGRELPDAVEDWEEEWNLRANPWFTLRVVIRAGDVYGLGTGALLPDRTAPPGFAAWIWYTWPSDLRNLVPLAAESFNPPAFDRTTGSKADWRRSVEEKLAEYEARTAERVASTPRKKGDRDFRWLARSRLLGESPATIMDCERLTDWETIKRAIGRTKELVGFA